MNDEEAWRGEEHFTAEIEKTHDAWLIWRRALNVARYPFRNRTMSMAEEFETEDAAARAVFLAGRASVTPPSREQIAHIIYNEFKAEEWPTNRDDFNEACDDANFAADAILTLLSSTGSETTP